MNYVSGWAILGLGAASMLTAGCNKKVPECNSMVEVINPAVESISKVDTTSEDNAVMMKSLETLTSTLDSTAKGLAALELTTPELQKYSTDYQAMCTQAAASAKEVSQIVTTLSAKEKEAEPLGKGLDEAMTKLTTVCNAPTAPAACEAVGKVLATVPDDLGKTAETEKFLAALKAVETPDAALKDAIAALVSSSTAHQKLLSEVNSMQTKADAASKAMSTALEKEDALVDSLNAFCQQ